MNIISVKVDVTEVPLAELVRLFGETKTCYEIERDLYVVGDRIEAMVTTDDAALLKWLRGRPSMIKNQTGVVFLHVRRGELVEMCLEGLSCFEYCRLARGALRGCTVSLHQDENRRMTVTGKVSKEILQLVQTELEYIRQEYPDEEMDKSGMSTSRWWEVTDILASRSPLVGTDDSLFIPRVTPADVKAGE